MPFSRHVSLGSSDIVLDVVLWAKAQPRSPVVLAAGQRLRCGILPRPLGRRSCYYYYTASKRSIDAVYCQTCSSMVGYWFLVLGHVDVLWPNGWTDRDETRHAGLSRPSNFVLDGSPSLGEGV